MTTLTTNPTKMDDVVVTRRDPVPFLLDVVRTAAQVLIAIGVAVIAW